MIGYSTRCFLFASLLVLLIAPVVQAAEDPSQVLAKMFQARRTVSYEGDFLYFQDEALTTLHIVRQAGKNIDRERLFTLDGSVREVVRSQDRVTCTLPRGQSHVANSYHLPTEDAFPENLSLPHNDLATFYTLTLGQDDRIAGRNVRFLEASPRDAFRYGHRFWVDTATGLLLKSELIGQQGKILERVMFIRVNLSDTMPTEPVAANGVLATPPLPSATTAKRVDDEAAHWVVEHTPPGFRLEGHDQQSLGLGQAPVRRIVYSDGLATVSVFIEHAVANRETMRGLSKRGALYVYATHYRDWQVTVLGVVPKATIEMIGTSLLSRD